MASADFQVRNGIIANTSITVGTGATNVTINTTSFSGTANNSNNLGGVAAASYVNTSGAYSLSGIITHTGNAVFSNAITISAGANVYANGVLGTAGYSLLSNGSSVYWGFASVNTAAQYTWSNQHTYSANVVFNGTVSAQANTLNQTLTDGATVNWDVSLGQIATVTLGGNRTIAAPTNLKVSTYILHVIQDGTGSRTLTWNSVFKWPAGVAPTLTTNAAARDVFSFVSDGTNLYGSFLPNVK